LSGLINWKGGAKGVEVTYGFYISVGLILSSCGDMMLEIDDSNKEYFIAGLAAFLLAHLSYICAFTTEAIQYRAFIFIISYTFYAAMMTILLPTVEADLVLPIIVYGFVISTMLLFGISRYNSTSYVYTSGSKLFSLIGSIFFIFSDTILALDKFAFPITSAKTIIMLTYYIGQTFIAISTCEDFKRVKKQQRTE